MSNIVTYDSQGHSHFVPASRERSIVRRFLDSMSGGLATKAVRSSEHMVGADHVSAFLSQVRASGEAGITGAALGAIDAAGMIEYNGVPVDLAGWLAGSGLGVIFARSEFGQTLRTVGATSLGVFTYRGTKKWMAAGSKMHGESWNDSSTIDTTGETEMGEDPIVAAAMQL